MNIQKTISAINSKWLIYTLLFAFYVFVHSRLYQYAFDDAYIHFRVARNLVETGMPYFNANEMVKVSTSSGWTIFLAFAFTIARIINLESHFPLLISLVNATITFWAMFIYTKIVGKLLKVKSSILQILIFQSIFIVLLTPSSIGLMETPLAILLAGIGINLLLLSRSEGFAFLGLAVYIRLELLALLVLICIVLIVQKNLKPLESILYFGAGLLPILCYDLYFFHTIIPHSIIAKSIVYSIPWTTTAIYILFTSLSFFQVSNNIIYFEIAGILFSALCIFIIVSVWQEVRKGENLWYILFPTWGLVTICAFIFKHILIFEWYIPLYTVPILVASYLYANQAKHPRVFVGKIFIIALSIISVITLIRISYASMINPSIYTEFESGSRVKSYLYIGKLLKEEYPEASIVTSEIGGIGYSFGGKIFDAAGLASPNALKYHPMKIPDERSYSNIGAIPPKYIEATMPDIIITYDYFAEALIKSMVSDQYNLILLPAYLPEDAKYSKQETIWGSKYFRIYIRKDLPVAEKLLDLGY